MIIENPHKKQSEINKLVCEKWKTIGIEEMNNWNKVEKRQRAATDQDIFFEYLKSACFIVAGLVYLYFLFIHKG